MADNFQLNNTNVSGGPTYRDLDRAGVRTQVVQLDLGGAASEVLAAGTVPVSGTVAVSNMVAQGLTDAQLRLTAVPISGVVSVSNMVAQGLTDAQLRLTPVPVSGTVTTGGLTDAQLRAAAVPVSAPKSTAASAPAQTAVGVAAAQILAAASRKRMMVVNTGTTVIKLALGAAPTQTAYHVALGAASAADNGTGGVYMDDDWIGAVQAISSAAGGTIVITELT